MTFKKHNSELLRNKLFFSEQNQLSSWDTHINQAQVIAISLPKKTEIVFNTKVRYIELAGIQTRVNLIKLI